MINRKELRIGDHVLADSSEVEVLEIMEERALCLRLHPTAIFMAFR